MDIPSTRFSLTLASLALLSLAPQASASSPYWDIFFVAPPQVLATPREAWVLRDSTNVLSLLSAQTEYCLHEQPGGGNGSCPISAHLGFELTPLGTQACIVGPGSSCIESGSISIGAEALVVLSVPADAPLQTGILRVEATAGFESDLASLTVNVVPELFAPPTSLKVFRGGVATTVDLQLSRPSGLTKPIDVFLASSHGSAGLASAGFSPATLSGNTAATTMSLAAFSNSPLGLAQLEVAARVIGNNVEATLLRHPFEVLIADAITPILPPPISMPRNSTRTVQIGAFVDPDATDQQPTFSLTGCNCTEMKSQVALAGTSLLIQTSATAPFGELRVGVRATAGPYAREFVVPIRVTLR